MTVEVLGERTADLGRKGEGISGSEGAGLRSSVNESMVKSGVCQRAQKGRFLDAKSFTAECRVLEAKVDEWINVDGLEGAAGSDLIYSI